MLNRLLGRPAPLPATVAEAVEKLAQLGEAHPELRELAATNVQLLETMYGYAPPRLPVDLEQAHAATKLAGGVPLLRGEPVVLDGDAVREQFLRLCRVMERRGNEFAPAVARAARQDTFPVAELAREAIAGDPRAAVVRAGALDLDAGLAATLLRLALFPMLERLAGDLKPLVDAARWRRGYCPVCGSWPLLGEYRGLEMARFLRCGLCATEWEVDRLVCPICDNRVHQDLLHLSVEGEEASQRAVACRRCHGYVKQIATLGAIPAPQLFVADLATLHLDLVAHERGYMPPS